MRCMTAYSLQPRKLADLSPENLRTLVEDMCSGPGWYASADLYRWYMSMCEEDNLEPVTKKRFGTVLRQLGYRSSIRRMGGKHCRSWYLTRRAFRGGAEPRKP